MLESERLIESLRTAAKSQGFSRYYLAKQAQLHTGTLLRFWEPEWNPTLATLKKLEAVIAEPTHQPL